MYPTYSLSTVTGSKRVNSLHRWGRLPYLILSSHTKALAWLQQQITEAVREKQCIPPTVFQL